MNFLNQKDYKCFSNYIEKFNSSPELLMTRELYKNNFDLIVIFIKRYGYNLALEDISELDLKLKPVINLNNLILKKINKAIFLNYLKLDDIK